MSTNASARQLLLAEIAEANILGTRLAEVEHPMMLYAQWFEWHTKLYWSIADVLGGDAARQFELAGGGLHFGHDKLRPQIAVLQALASQLINDDTAAR